MNRLLILPVLLLVLLVGEPVLSAAPCPGDYDPKTWTRCIGIHSYSDGREYVGEYRHGKRHGRGTQTIGAMGKYEGEWKDDKRHGQGHQIYGDGDEYHGEWRYGDRHGVGRGKTATGFEYVGEWKNDDWNGKGRHTWPNGRVDEGIWKDGKLITPQSVYIAAPPSPSSVERENERLRRENARLRDARNRKPQGRIARPTPKPKPSPPRKTSGTGSGFFVSKLGHIITNEHVVRNCQNITVGDNAKKQVPVTLVETDKRNDLALLKISSTKMSSADTTALIRKLGVEIVPLASEGLLRSEDIELGEDVLVAGYPYGDIFSNSIKVTKGIVSANRGMGDDTGQFQIDAAVQPGNSGGPIYDAYGNVVGVVVAQLNKLKVAKAIGSLPENVNFGIKASTVRQFLTASGLPTKWSNRSKGMSSKNLAKIAKNQTVMVVCNR